MTTACGRRRRGKAARAFARGGKTARATPPGSRVMKTCARQPPRGAALREKRCRYARPRTAARQVREHDRYEAVINRRHSMCASIQIGEQNPPCRAATAASRFDMVLTSNARARRRLHTWATARVTVWRWPRLHGRAASCLSDGLASCRICHEPQSFHSVSRRVS